MHIEEPDYEKYTINQLRDAYDHIDREKHPERTRRIEEELDKRVPEEGRTEEPPAERHPENGVPPRASWFRRGVAFWIDYVIVMIGIGVIKNLFGFPLPEFVLHLIAPLIFVLYFLVHRDGDETAASIGKKIMGITVARLDGKPISALRITLRAGILAGLVLLPWESLLNLLPFWSIPLLAALAILSVRFGMAFYSFLLTFKDPLGRTFHDQIAGTRVVHIIGPPLERSAFDQILSKGPSGRRFLRPSLTGFSIVVVAVCVCGFYFSLGGLLGLDVGSMILKPVDEVAATQDWFEDHLAESMSLRTDVEMQTVTTWRTGEPKRRELEVEVWIPAVRWNEEVRQEAANAILENLRVTPGLYDGGSLTLWTGLEYLKISKTMTLKFDE